MNPTVETCKKCNDWKYILYNCCSGHGCGCMGLPVAVSNCPDCNPNGEAEPPEYIREYVEHCEYIG